MKFKKQNNGKPNNKSNINNKFSNKSNINRIDGEIKQLKEKYLELKDNPAAVEFKRFTDFPLSQKTLNGLKEAHYVTPTDIQKESILPALQGRDVLGAAITGSGKTLAFLIPVLENLFINKWSRTDGIGAIIISPTRELAYQIFETLKKVGKEHDFSAGLIIGGKNLKFERRRMDQCNILICTPGRLLQHMDENPLFNASTMSILILDEADRCLDMGFEQTLNAIIDNLPPERQTLLFSATQTNSIRDLTRLNLKDPVYIGHKQTTTSINNEPHESVSNVLAVPELLQQHYVVIALEDKITMLWSFIKNHSKQKIIVFLSSCKQVKYIFEIFCKLRPGISLLALYGTLHQDRRIAIYNDFLKKSHVVLFATDIASRGLDFPSVNWVVQLDCPEDVKQYVHRAGRSARNKKRGESLLVLLPSEEAGMLQELNQQNINVAQIQIDPKKLFSPRVKIEAFLAQHQELKDTAQRAFVAYIKSLFLMKNKKIFDVHALDFNAYAHSLGLAITPRVRFLERYDKKQKEKGTNPKKTKQTTEHPMLAFKTSDDDDNDSDSASASATTDDDDDDFLQLKRADHGIQGVASDGDGEIEELPLPVPRQKKDKVLTKTALAKRALKKKLLVNEKRLFDDNGEEIIDERKEMQSELAKKAMEANAEGGIDLEMSKKLLNEEDKYDKQRFRALVKQRHKQTKKKLKEIEQQNDVDDDDDANSEKDDGDYDSDGNSVDLSWLPDPKKVYNNNNRSDTDGNDSNDEDTPFNNESQDEDDANDNDSDEYEAPLPKKPKVTSKLTLDDAEIIAAQLLANS